MNQMYFEKTDWYWILSGYQIKFAYTQQIMLKT